jgi:hypothetical protein
MPTKTPLGILYQPQNLKLNGNPQGAIYLLLFYQRKLPEMRSQPPHNQKIPLPFMTHYYDTKETSLYDPLLQ